MRRLLPIALNQVATVVFGMVGVSLISHIVPNAVFGSYALFLTLTSFGQLLTHSGLINHATRYWQREHLAAGAYARFLLTQTWRRGLPLAGLLLFVSGFQAATRGVIWLELWPLLFAGNLVLAVSGLAAMMLNAGERHWAVFTLNALAAAARALLPAGLALAFGATLLVLSSGFALHAAAVAIAILCLFSGLSWSGQTDPGLEARWHTELREFGRPFVWMGVGSWLLLNADRWVVGVRFGEVQLGTFTLASNIASIIPNMVCAGMLQWVFPAVFRQADAARSTKDWRKLARRCDQFTLLFLAVTVSGLLCLKFLSPFLVPWLISRKYAPGLPYLLPAGLAAAATQVNQFQYLLLQGQHDSNSMVRVMVLLASIRTAGSILAAWISWPVFLGWLMVSTLLVSLLGRARIQHLAFQKAAVLVEADIGIPR
jgi:O-antigen/teichoic acid export membrane protein